MRMNPKVKEYRQDVADAFVESLEKQSLDWKCGWNTVSVIQSNALTGNTYRGINQLYLYMMAQKKGYTDSRWATFKQIQDKGWKLQKGAKGEKIEYWMPFDEKEKKFITWGEYRQLRAQTPDVDLDINIYPRYYTVFNGKFIDGLEPLPDLSSNPIPPLNDIVAKISASMRVEILNDGGKYAFYSPAEDRIHLPEQQAFVSEYEYNVTALHELTHATAAANRLNRPLDNTFGSQAYAYEELVAELGSVFMGIHLPIEQTQYHIDNHAAYVQAWIQGIKKQPDVLIRAIREAERAADYLEYHAELLPLAEAEKNNHLSFEMKDKAVQDENKAIQQSNNQEKGAESLGRLEFFTLGDKITYHSSPEEAIKKFTEAQNQREVCTLGFHFPEIESKRFAMFTITQQGISSVDNLDVLMGQHPDVKMVAEQIAQIVMPGPAEENVRYRELAPELRGKVKSMQAAGKFFELNSKGCVKVPEGAEKWLNPAEIDSVSSYIKDKAAEKGKVRHSAIGCDCEP